MKKYFCSERKNTVCTESMSRNVFSLYISVVFLSTELQKDKAWTDFDQFYSRTRSVLTRPFAILPLCHASLSIVGNVRIKFSATRLKYIL